MKKIWVFAMVGALLISHQSHAESDQVITVGEVSGVGLSVDEACRKAKEQAIVESKQRASHWILSASEIYQSQVGEQAHTEYKRNVVDLQGVEAKMVSKGAERHHFAEDNRHIVCELQQVTVQLDETELQRKKALYLAQIKQKQLIAESKRDLLARLNRNHQRYQQMERQVTRFQVAPVSERITCSDEQTLLSCKEAAKQQINQRQAQKVAQALGVDSEYVQAQLVSDIELQEVQKALNGRVYHLTSPGTFNIGLADPFSAENAEIEASLKSAEQPQVRSMPEQVEANNDDSIGADFLKQGWWQFALVYSQFRSKRDQYGLHQTNQIYVGGLHAGVKRFFTPKAQNWQWGVSLGFGKDEWGVCTADDGKRCTTVKRFSLPYFSLGAQTGGKRLLLGVDWVFYQGDEVLDAQTHTPKGYPMMWVSLMPFSTVPFLKATLGGRFMQETSPYKFDGQTFIGIEASF